MNPDGLSNPIQFSDSICTCKSCKHGIASICRKVDCDCCTNNNHSMVLDGIEGFGEKN